jgi:hypothetical protein
VVVDDGRSERRVELNRRLRAEFIAGAEEDSRRRLGRGLTAEELERVLRRYPGDVVTTRSAVLGSGDRRRASGESSAC